jgi:ribosomal protein S18 acetylase RimI-like enzyme
VIRTSTPADLPGVAQVWAACGRDALPGAELAAVLAHAPELLLVAEDPDTGIVGVVLGTSDERRGWIHRLAVLPTHRRRGLAGGLVEELERRFAARGLSRVNLLVMPEDEPALRFWAGRGYLSCPDVLHTRPLPGAGAVQRS